jgi:hypothetical protein
MSETSPSAVKQVSGNTGTHKKSAAASRAALPPMAGLV